MDLDWEAWQRQDTAGERMESFTLLVQSWALLCPIPPLPTTAYTTKTSKQKKTNEEKQAKKKESDRRRKNQSILYSILLTLALIWKQQD